MDDNFYASHPFEIHVIRNQETFEQFVADYRIPDSAQVVFMNDTRTKEMIAHLQSAVDSGTELIALVINQ